MKRTCASWHQKQNKGLRRNFPHFPKKKLLVFIYSVGYPAAYLMIGFLSFIFIWRCAFGLSGAIAIRSKDFRLQSSFSFLWPFYCISVAKSESRSCTDSAASAVIFESNATCFNDKTHCPILPKSKKSKTANRREMCLRFHSSASWPNMTSLVSVFICYSQP